MLGDGQAESRTAGLARTGRVDPVESLENAVQRFGGDADALIDHANGDFAIALPHADRHSGVFGRVMDGVLYEVLDGGLHGLFVGLDHRTARGRAA